MLTANKLEKIIELEDNLRAEYQEKLDAQTAEVSRCQQELAEQRTQLQSTIDTQLETIADLSKKASVNQKLEQQNRELFNRSENMKEEVAGQKQRIKSLQNDLAKEREEPFLDDVASFSPLTRVSHNLSTTAFFAVMDAFFPATEAFFAVGLKLLPRFPRFMLSLYAALAAFFAAAELACRVRK